MSSPSTPENLSNSHPINHFHQKNSWHTSYTPLDILNIWINSIDGQLRPCGNKLPPPACTFFLNRISRTESMSYSQRPQGSSFWRSPRSRHSERSPRSCHSERSEESPYWPLLRRCTFRRTDTSRTESMFYQQFAANESFAGTTRIRASFSPITLRS